MKKIIRILRTIGLTATNTTPLISCEKPNNKNIPCEKQDHGNWKQQCSQDKPFNKIDNKWYIVLSRFEENDNWEIFKFKNENGVPSTSNPKIKMIFWWPLSNYRTIAIKNASNDPRSFRAFIKENVNKYFKTVYRWDGVGEPNLPEIDKNTDKITDWKD